MANKKIKKQLAAVQKALGSLRKKAGRTGNALVAGVTGAVLVLGNMASSVREGAKKVKKAAQKKSQEVVTVKKSTLVALLVALAAVAGVLGALYFYVLRREKELDEYEQLLFSEDFTDDFVEEELPAAEEAAE